MRIAETIDASRKIFNALGDQESKYIFKERLLFSYTNETEHIKNVVSFLDEGKWFENILKERKNLYIFGAGTWGKEIIKIWPNQWKGFLDNNVSLWGTEIIGIPILNPKDVLSESNEINVLISSRLYYKEIYGQLKELGVLDENIINIGQVLDNLAERQYFDLPYLNLKSDEVFVDVGSLDGMSAIRFVKRVNNSFEKIYCFEPDERNIPKCEKNLQKYISCEKTTVVKKGAWSEEGVLHFYSSGNGTSSFTFTDEAYSCDVGVTTIDKVFESKKVSFIKMDIEGAEYEALKGCQNIIQTQRPKLAICIYHKPEDIITLPQLILDYNPDYKLYLRHYSVTAAETVLYAI